MSPREPQSGSMLLELLVALALLSLVVVLLLPGLRLTARTAVLSQMQNEVTAQDNALAAVERLLASALPLDGDEAAFAGTASEVRFIAARPGSDAGSGVARVDVAVVRSPESGDDRLRLVVRASPLGGAAAGAARAQEDVIITQMKSAGFRYFGAHGPREAPRWQSSWTRVDAFPDLIDILVEPADGSPIGYRIVELKLRPKS